MPENRFANVAIGCAPRIASHGQSQQSQRIKGVTGRQLQGDALILRQPHHLAVSPLPLAGNFRRPELPMVFEQARKQQRLVGHAVTDAL